MPTTYFPSTITHYPKIPFLFPTPSPLHPLPRLSSIVSSSASVHHPPTYEEESHPSIPHTTLYLKREDLSSPLGLGGNKLRKLSYILPSALSTDAPCDSILTTGEVQSNHMRQVAAAGAHLGLPVYLVVKPPLSQQNDAFHALGNVQINALLGAHYIDEEEARGKSLDEVALSLKQQGKRPYVLAGGGAGHDRAGLGYAEWALEVVEQERGLGVYFNTIIVAVASGGTIGGMVAGFRLAEQLAASDGPARGESERYRSEKSKDGRSRRRRRRRNIIGIDTYGAVLPIGQLETQILDTARCTAKLLSFDPSNITEDDFRLDRRFNQGGHVGWSDTVMEGAKLLARTEGVVTDPVYSGRAVAAAIEMMKAGEVEGDVLVVHTGGQPAVGAFGEFR